MPALCPPLMSFVLSPTSTVRSFDDVQPFHDMQQHAGFGLQAESIVSADDKVKVLRAQSLQNHVGVFDRLVRGHGFSLVRKMSKHFFHARIEDGPIQTMGKVVPAKDLQRLVEAHPVVSLRPPAEAASSRRRRQTRRFLPATAAAAPALRSVKIDRGRNVPFRLDQRAVQIENQQVDLRHSHSPFYLAVRNSLCSTARLSRLAGSVSFTQASLTKLIIRFWPTCGGNMGSMMRHRFRST